MSLNIYLQDVIELKCSCGQSHDVPTNIVYEANITHNLTAMADEAGIYQAIWRPEENNFKKASDIFDIVDKGVRDMDKRPLHYRKFNSENGWGTYEDFVPWLEDLRDALEEYPNAIISVSR